MGFIEDLGAMIRSIKQGLLRIVRFSGRDTPEDFWSYAAFVLLIVTVMIAGPILYEMLDALAKMQRFAAEHPELTTVEIGPGSYSIRIEGDHPELSPPDFGRVFSFISAAVGGAVVLLSAAVARRLHDTGRSGFWGLLPTPFLAFSLTRMPELFAAAETVDVPLPLFASLLVSNMLYLASLGVLVLMLVRAGTPGANRFGPEPSKAS